MIPHVIHQVWVGPPMPAHLAAWRDEWLAMYPDFDHILWTEDTIPRLENQTIYDDAERIAPGSAGQLRSDVVRYELLARFGGVYVDLDMQPIQRIDPLLDVECFAAWEATEVWINNAVMGAVPDHPLLLDLVRLLPKNVRRKAGKRPNHLSGPRFLTPIVRLPQHADAVTVYPKAFFYPYLWSELDRGAEAFPDAYAVHHWHNARTKAGK